MSTSVYGGRLLTGRPWGSNAALDAGFVRDFVHNNLAHFADQSAQVYVCWAATGSGINSGTTYIATVENGLLSFGPFPIRLRQDGRSYKMRIRIAASQTAGDFTCRFYGIVAPAQEAASLIALEDYVYYTAGATTSPAWLTGQSLGSEAYPTMIDVPAELTSQWMSTTSTLDNVGGDPVGVEQCLVSLNIITTFTYTGGGAVIPEPRIHGVYLAEFIGDD